MQLPFAIIPLIHFTSDRARVEYLFQLYEQYTAPLMPSTKAKKKKAVENPEEDSAREEIEAPKSKLPQWYLDAFKPHGEELMRGEMLTHNLQAIYSHIDAMLEQRDFAQCDALLKELAHEPGETPLVTLVGYLRQHGR